jgi:Flp pilus assembly protein TadD
MIRGWMLRLVPVLLVAVAYGECLHYPFVYDDKPGIQGDAVVSQAGTIAQACRALLEHSRPVTRFSYAAQHVLFGFSNTAFHTANILIHIVNTLLVFGIALKVGKRWVPDSEPQLFGLAAATIHAVHPLYTEAVTYISGRSSSLCALFYFACLLSVLLALDSRLPARRAAWYFAAAAAGALAWAAKEEAITLPFMVAALLILAGYTRSAIGVVVLPVGVLIARWPDVAALYRTTAANQTLANVGLGGPVQPLLYMLSEVKASVCYYLIHFAVPLTQSVDPYFPTVHSAAEPGFLIAAAVLALLFALALYYRPQHPSLTFSIAALLLSPLLAYAVMPLPDMVAEHRVYITGLGVDLIFAWILIRAQRLMWPLAVFVTIALTSVTVMRNSVWKTEIRLWQQAATNAPNQARPHLNLGVAFQVAGQFDRALLEYRTALSIQPKLPVAYTNMSVIYLREGLSDDAELLLKRAIELSPAMPQPYINLASIAASRNQSDKAFEYLARAEQAGARDYWVHFIRAEALVLSNQVDSARAEYEIASRLTEGQHPIHDEIENRLAKIAQAH